MKTEKANPNLTLTPNEQKEVEGTLRLEIHEDREGCVDAGLGHWVEVRVKLGDAGV
jgi:hypothetical protein